jgi:protein involved in ribonucleotide reduction
LYHKTIESRIYYYQLFKNVGILQDFKAKLIGAKEDVEKIKQGAEDFKTKHKMTSGVVSKLIKGLPPPFNAFGEIIWDGLEKQDDSDQKMLDILEKIGNNNETQFGEIKSSINKLIENQASKGDLRQLGEVILNSNEAVVQIIKNKADEILNRISQVDDDVKRVGKDVKDIKSFLAIASDEFDEKKETEFFKYIDTLKQESENELNIRGQTSDKPQYIYHLRCVSLAVADDWDKNDETIVKYHSNKAVFVIDEVQKFLKSNGHKLYIGGTFSTGKSLLAREICLHYAQKYASNGDSINDEEYSPVLIEVRNWAEEFSNDRKITMVTN